MYQKIRSNRRRRWLYSVGIWASGTGSKDEEEMQKLFLENERNEKIGTVNFRHLRHIMSGKDIQDFTEERPFLFSLIGMKAHFKYKFQTSRPLET